MEMPGQRFFCPLRLGSGSRKYSLEIPSTRAEVGAAPEPPRLVEAWNPDVSVKFNHHKYATVFPNTLSRCPEAVLKRIITAGVYLTKATGSPESWKMRR